MRIAFEDWLRNQDLSEEAMGCFDESFLCYRTRAYRAALLFSFLGLLTIVRERLMIANLPPNTPQTKWDDLRRRLRNEREWEEATYEATQSQKPAPYFSLNDDIRREFAYWRDRRNDAAHFKRRVIDYANVEGLWSFIQSRLALIAVIGSSDELITRIVDHFDPILTPPTKPVNALIASLSQTELPDGYAAFLNDLLTRLTSSHKARIAPLASHAFVDACLRLGSASLRASVASYIRGFEEFQESFLVRFPDHVGLLSGEPSLVRKLWNSKLDFGEEEDCFPLIASLLRSRLIPDDEVQECFQRILKAAPIHAPSSDDLPIFLKHNFLDVIEEVAERMMSTFDWANQSGKIIGLLIDSRQISQRLADTIYKTFDTTYNPRHLRPILREYFTGRPDKRREYETARRKTSKVDLYPLHLKALRPSASEREDE